MFSNETPIIFFMHEWGIVDKTWEGKVEKIVAKIALNEVDIYDVSFTFGDSMDVLDRPDRRPPLSER